MTDELLATDNTEASPVEGSDLATDTGENQEQKIEFSDEQQKVFDKAIGKKTFTQRQQQREFQQTDAKKDARIAELEAQIPKSTRPNIPDMPDSLDDDFQVQVQARDEAIRQQQAFDTTERLETERQQAAVLQTQNDQLADTQKRVDTYNQNATTLGIKPEELHQSETVLVQMGISGELATQLLQEDTGPLMTNYLAANPEAFDQLNNADQWNKGVILNDVRLKAAEMKPQLTAAPAPANILTGGGTSTTERGPKGATYT